MMLHIYSAHHYVTPNKHLSKLDQESKQNVFANDMTQIWQCSLLMTVWYHSSFAYYGMHAMGIQMCNLIIVYFIIFCLFKADSFKLSMIVQALYNIVNE